MDADHSVELGSTAPALEIPWQDTEGRLRYIDLRARPDSMQGNTERDIERNIERNIGSIPEAQQFPALRRFLTDLNSAQSVWQTAKCDVWSGDAEEAANLYGAEFSQGCYVDIVLADQSVGLRDSLEVHRRLAKEIAQRLEADDAMQATAEIVVRRCYFHRAMNIAKESDSGYCLTLFLTGYGVSAAEAAKCWERAMEFAAGCWIAMRPH